MGEMKGAVMKIGQVMSMMTGLVPPRWRPSSRPCSRGAADGYPLVEQVFRDEFGTTPTGYSGGSTASPCRRVHRPGASSGVARRCVGGGQVQYPGVRGAIRHDLERGIAGGGRGMVSRGLDAGPIVEDLKNGISAELDYEREAGWRHDSPNCTRDMRLCESRTSTPKSAAGVLVQEYLAGQPIRAVLSRPQAERNRIGEMIFRFTFGSIYRHGLFNGDPHPGNFLLLPDGTVGFVDYGCVTEFDATAVEGFKRIIRALLNGDIDAWRAATEDVGILKRGAPFSTEAVYEHMHWFWRRSSPTK
jgi:predicted unusual protein kinase regulating ubiquinone biosynthesis (AarF/ABC1/UbiB family)